MEVGLLRSNMSDVFLTDALDVQASSKSDLGVRMPDGIAREEHTKN